MSESYVFSLKSNADKDFFSSRTHAALLRKEIQTHLGFFQSVTIDFSDTEMTQSFADELIGVLAFLKGPELFKKIKFKGCSEEMKKIINFVVTQRLSSRSLEEKKSKKTTASMSFTVKSRTNSLEAVAC